MPDRLRLFGPPELAGERWTPLSPERRFQLLIVLALRSGEWVTRDEISALLWPGQSGSDARRNLRHALFKAHATSGVKHVEATPHAIRWSVATDVQDFHAAVRDKRFDDAVALRRGPLANGMDDAGNRAFSEWLVAERTRMEQLWHEAALEQLRSARDAADRIALAHRMLQADPLDEEAMRVLLAAEVALGHHAMAQRLYRDYATRLAEDLGVEPPQDLRGLLAEPVRAPVGAAPGDGRRFVGRRTELGELALLLGQPECRLITILGPGGVGKSSLARHARSNVEASFPGGAVWVDLQDLLDVPAVVARLAHQLGLEVDHSQDPVRQIASRLPEARTLAVLDNAEHLGELPGFLDRLLGAAPLLTIMLTSRTRTHSGHERLLPLEGLAVPDEESRDLEAASTFDAVRLFELRAMAAQQEFRLAGHLAAVLEVVDAVGGLPLAIELAAAWTRLLPTEEIARDLRGDIDMLERDPVAAGAPARPEHVSVRAVLDRSWQLLAPREREAMMSLSVFLGGFTHAAARNVGEVSLPVLSSLVDRSVLKVDSAGRFDTHPLVGADARARAASDAGRLLQQRDRHAAYFARQLADRVGEQSGDPRPVVEAIDADQANCHFAWRHAIARGRHDLVSSMCSAWRTYFSANGKYGQGVRHFEEALSVGGPPRVAAELCETVAYFLLRNREPERAATMAGKSLAIAETLGDSALVQSCTATIGSCKLIFGQWLEARTWTERSLGLARERGARRDTASALSNLGLISSFLGDFDSAAGMYDEAIAIQTELGNAVNVARAMCNLGFVHVARGDWPRAQQALEKALRYAQARGVAAVALEAEFLLGSTQVELGLLDEARRRLEHAREGFRVTRNAGFELKTGYYLARIAARHGRIDQAGEELLASVRTAREHDWSYDVLYAAIFVAEVIALRGCAREAARILLSIRAAPRAHAFVGTLVEAGLRALPCDPQTGTGAAELPAGAFDVIADLMATSKHIDEFISRLRQTAD